MSRTLLVPPFVTKTTTYTASVVDASILANGTFTVWLYPAASAPGQTLLIKNIGTGSVTVAANGAENIDANATYVVANGQSLSILNNGIQWWTAGGGVGGGTGSACNTPTFTRIGVGTAPHANAVAVFSGQYFATLSNAGNTGSALTFDFNTTNEHYANLNANCTFTLSNPIDGARYCLLVNSGAGGHRITWPAACSWGPYGQPMNTQEPSKVDIFTMMYLAATSKYYMSYSLGY